MTNEMIEALIAARNAITDRTDTHPNWKAVDHIDAVLREVPVGQRPDVDRLLGRKPTDAALTEPNQEQIDAARQAGNAAYDKVFEHARWNVASASDAYSAAYEDTLYRLMSDGLPDGIVDEYSSATEGAWK